MESPVSILNHWRIVKPYGAWALGVSEGPNRAHIVLVIFKLFLQPADASLFANQVLPVSKLLDDSLKLISV